MSETEIKESDYIKRSIELNKYLFSSSAALLLITTWNILSDPTIQEFVFEAQSLILYEIFFIIAGILTIISFYHWKKCVEELKK